jgi:hypothetical protein
MTAAPTPAEKLQRIAWNQCKDGNPQPDVDRKYLVTIYCPHTKLCTTKVGKYLPASFFPNDTEPKDSWMVLDDVIQDGAYSVWEPPLLWNSVVIAWSEMPRPWTGETEQVKAVKP